MNDKLKFIGSAIAGIGICLLLIWLSVGHHNGRTTRQYYHNKGFVFGTYYNIQYESDHDMEVEIQAELQRLDGSLSMFNPNSTISRINRGEDMATDSLFEVMYETAREVSLVSGGAFDITVRPLVNAWGFGNKKKEREAAKAQGSTPYISQDDRQAEIDSIRRFVGYQMITLTDHRIIKSDDRITIDASAIAKGMGVDVAANVIARSGSENYLVDIGGEVVAKGHNSEGNAWRIGISTPNDDPNGTSDEIQEIIHASDMAMATSGNYRQFYMDGDVRRSHTIDPRTGYPVAHSLLSATVTASSCMRADALATACMVLGADAAIQMIEQIPDAECYLIVGKKNGTMVVTSKKWGKK